MGTLLRIAVAVVLVAAGANAVAAATDGVTTPNSSLGSNTELVTANDIKPASCAGITVTTVVSGTGTITGSAASELITGSGAADVIDGSLGDDCILGGAGDDDITGNSGTDVCIGGGDAGDVFTTCETTYP